MTTMTAPASKGSTPKVKVKQTKMLIDGKWVDSVSGKTFETINPATGQVIARVAEADKADVSFVEDRGNRAIVGVAVRVVVRVQPERVDPRVAGALQPRRFAAIRDDDRDRRLQRAGRDRVDDRLQVAPPARDQHGNSGSG